MFSLCQNVTQKSTLILYPISGGKLTIMPLLISGWHIRWVSHYASHSLMPESIMNPETEVTCFVNAQVSGSKKMLAQVANQRFWSGWLTGSLVLELLCWNADSPAFLTYVQPNINLLTCEVKSGILLHEPFLPLLYC